MLLASQTQEDKKGGRGPPARHSAVKGVVHLTAQSRIRSLPVSGLWTYPRVHLAPRGIVASPGVFPGVLLSSSLSPQRV